MSPLGNGSESDLRIPYDFPEIVGISAVAETFPDRIRTYPAGSVFCLSGAGRNRVKRPVRSGFRPAYPLPATNFGDASADGKLAGLVGISKSLGVFKNQLQTSEEPYGWTLNFEDSTSNSATFEEKMKAFSCMLIALTGNLGEVQWNYTVELEDGPVQRSGRMTEAECSEYVGAPVKSFADSPEGVQALLDLLEISDR